MIEQKQEGESQAPVAERITDPEEVKKLFRVRPAFKYMERVLIQMVADSGAILKGHFKLREDGEQ